MNTDNSFDKLSLLYQENAKVAAIFWEWRYKLMTYFFAVIIALSGFAGWLYQQQTYKLLFIPFFLGFFISLFSLLLDNRNRKILQKCYQVGKDIENELSGKGGIFGAIETTYNNQSFSIKVTYTWILHTTYSLSAITFLVFFILSLIFR